MQHERAKRAGENDFHFHSSASVLFITKCNDCLPYALISAILIMKGEFSLLSLQTVLYIFTMTKLQPVLNNQAHVSANVANNEHMMNIIEECIQSEIDDEQRRDAIRNRLVTPTPTTVWNISDRD